MFQFTQIIFLAHSELNLWEVNLTSQSIAEKTQSTLAIEVDYPFSSWANMVLLDVFGLSY